MQGPSSPVVVGFPLRGEWVAVRTPAHKVPSHGTDMFGQRYAFDFVRPDHRAGLHLHPAGALRSFLLGGRTRDYYGWGQPVHAAFDGEVVEAVDGVPERARVHVVRELALALKTTVRFDPARRGLDPVAGNRVIVQGADAVALFVHLAPGTVSVTRGQEVRAGEVIGRVGHTGNSTAPTCTSSSWIRPTHCGPRASPAPSRPTSCSAAEGGSGSSAASLADANGSAPCPTGPSDRPQDERRGPRVTVLSDPSSTAWNRDAQPGRKALDRSYSLGILLVEVSGMNSKVAISLPEHLLAWVEEARGTTSRSAFFAELVRAAQAEQYRRGYREQPDAGEEYVEPLALEALNLDPYEPADDTGGA